MKSKELLEVLRGILADAESSIHIAHDPYTGRLEKAVENLRDLIACIGAEPEEEVLVEGWGTPNQQGFDETGNVFTIVYLSGKHDPSDRPVAIIART